MGRVALKDIQSGRRGTPLQEGAAVQNVWDAIREYELEEHVAELETWGLTVVPPEKAAPEGFWQRLREGVLRFVEKIDGKKPDLETGESHRNEVLGSYHYLVASVPEIQESMCQPVALAFLDYLLGEGAIIHANSALCKGPHDDLIPGSDIILPLHSDNQLLPGPFHSWAEFANVTWVLSEYSKEDGALAWVPGSRHLCRHPLPGEGQDKAVPVEAPPGSMVVWHGNTWHGAYRRTKPGLRLSVGSIFSRPYIWPRHPLREDISQEALDANPPRFAKLCGKHVMTNWREEGPDYGPHFQHAYPTKFS